MIQISSLKKLFHSVSYCKLRILSRLHVRSLSTKSDVKVKAGVQWEPVIGLEIHAQISAESKLFSGAGAEFAVPINSQVSMFDASLPGTLPVINRRCVEAGVLTSLALSCEINPVSKFDRKHYFYADLPAGYQITQQREPIARNGVLSYLISNPQVTRTPYYKEVRIIQVQLEQDSGKSLHDAEAGHSLIDLNRAGMGLMEIVTEPDFSSADDAAAFVRELQLILQSIGTCDGNMSEGNMRIDANISVRRPGEELGVRAEVKNINSIRYVKRAIEFEIGRQIKILEGGKEVINETRNYDFETGETIAMRDKEKIQDYRFMPEPNLPPLRLYTDGTIPADLDSSQVINIHELQRQLPELPAKKRQRLQEEYGLNIYQSIIIVNEDGFLEFFDEVMKHCRNAGKAAGILLTVSLQGILNADNLTIKQCCVPPVEFSKLAELFSSYMISKTIAQKVLRQLYDGSKKTALEIIEDNNWMMIKDEDHIDKVCSQILQENPKAVQTYLKGKKKTYNFFIKTVHETAGGTLSPPVVDNVLTRLLEKLKPS